MDIPESLNAYLKPVLLTQPVDDMQLPSGLERKFSSVVNHFQNKRGNLVLFYGASASENAFAACLLAKRVQRDVYRLDLSAAASSHIGDTEKHLLNIFEFAREQGFVLLIDEVDSLFSQRSGIHTDDARYGNLDLNYLLRRFSEYPEFIIVTTNSRDNLDKTLLREIPWQVNLEQPKKQSNLPFWQRFFRRQHN